MSSNKYEHNYRDRRQEGLDTVNGVWKRSTQRLSREKGQVYAVLASKGCGGLRQGRTANEDADPGWCCLRRQTDCVCYFRTFPSTISPVAGADVFGHDWNKHKILWIYVLIVILPTNRCQFTPVFPVETQTGNNPDGNGFTHELAFQYAQTTIQDAASLAFSWSYIGLTIMSGAVDIPCIKATKDGVIFSSAYQTGCCLTCAGYEWE